jgi:2,4-dienoyl-CoA reductase-like NADH-dependent reductase (Old Yellow Enzyme family)
MPPSNTHDRYPHVFQPLTIGATHVRHRIMVTGHTQLYGHNGTLSERHIDYYRERAQGGAALLVLEQQAAHPSGRNYFAGCEAWDERVIPWYERLGEAVHEYDCRQFVQLFACGAQGSGTQYIDDWRPLWAASRIPSAVTEEMPVAMEQVHIDELVDYFARSALNVQRAGLDGVEIHAAHSQLLGEFLSPAFNKRDDAYGGSMANRCRLVLEVGDAIRASVGPDFTLGLRLSFDEYLGPAGITAEQCEEQIEIFSQSGLFDFFDISAGGYHTLHIAVAPMGTLPEAFLADSARRARAVAGDRARIFVVGRFLDLHHAEAVLAAGDADMVAMTRAHMADADVVNKSAAGAEQDVIRCIGANVCVARLIENREVTCVQNPSMGREAHYGAGTLASVTASAAKDICVIGGGPAGLRFAGTAAERGHKVRLFESDDELGGRLNVIKRLPTRGSWQGAIDNLARRLERFDVEINTSTQINEKDADGDVIILASGAVWTTSGYSPYRPERDTIPGHEQAFVIDIGDAIERSVADPRALGTHVMIVDETGDYLPLGLAELLGEAGIRVEIVSPRPFVGADTQRTLDMPHVLPRLKKLGVQTTALHFVEQIDDHNVTVYDVWGGDPQVREDIDTVVMAMTRLPHDELYGALNSGPTPVHRLGDVVAPRRLEAIIFDAEKLARQI